MEVAFQDELPEFNNFLNPQLRKQFYDKLKRVVVLILIERNMDDGRRGKQVESESPPVSASDRFEYGGGVVMNREGCILTCASIFPKNLKNIRFRLVDEEGFREAALVVCHHWRDLAILKPKGNETEMFDFSKFGVEEDIDVGMEVFSIAHPTHMCYNFVAGQVCFPCEYGKTDGSLSPRSKTPSCRIVGGVRQEGVDPDLRCLNRGLHLIQINNHHGSTGAFGAPVFDSWGRVIGINSFSKVNFDFAIHLRVLKEFYNNFHSNPPREESSSKAKKQSSSSSSSKAKKQRR